MLKAEYLSKVEYSRRFTAEDIFFTEAGLDFPDLYQATTELLESGQTAWFIPEFEQSLQELLIKWVKEGRLIRAQMTAKWLRETAEGYSAAWLDDFARGQFSEHLNAYELQCSIAGPSSAYLYPLQFGHLVKAQLRENTRKAMLNQKGAALAFKRYGAKP